MSRWRSSGALSIDAKSRTTVLPPASASTLVIAAVSVVFPWSMCPIVPTLTCGFERSNFCLAIAFLPPLPDLGAAAGFDDLGCDRLRDVFVVTEIHVERRAALRHRTNVGRLAEQLRKRDDRFDDLRVAEGAHRLDSAATPVQ